MSTATKEHATESIDVSDDLYKDVVNSSMLQEVRLVNSLFDIKQDYFSNIDQELSLSFDGKMSNVHYDPSMGIAAGDFLWSAYVKKKKKQLCKIKSQYMVVYTVGENSDEKAVHKFVKIVGRFAIFPYFRALVSQYSSASSANLPVLPVLKQHF